MQCLLQAQSSQWHTVCSTNLSLSHIWSYDLLSICPSIGLSLSHTLLSPKCCHPHISLPVTVPLSCFSSLTLSSLMLRCTPLSSYVNNTWPLRLRIGGEKKIYSLWMIFCLHTSWDPHARSICPASEKNTEQTLVTHTVIPLLADHPSIYRQNKTSLSTVGLSYSFMFPRIMGHHHLKSYSGNLLCKSGNLLCIGNICSQ